MQSQAAAPQGAGHYPNPYLVYGAPSGFAPLTDEAGVYLPTGPGDAQQRRACPHHANTARRLFTFLPNVAANSLPRRVCLRISTL